MVSFYSILLLDNRNLLFHLVAWANLILSTHIIDREIMKVLVRNTSNWPLCIFHQQKLSHDINLYYNNFFFAKTKSALQVVVFFSKTWPFFEYEFSCILTPTDLCIETRLDHSLKIYGDKQAVIFLTQCMVEYPSIWESKGFV